MTSHEPGSLEAHERLVRECLEELALRGLAAWENPRRAVNVNGRWVSPSKSGRGDIQTIFPKQIGYERLGVHGEIECKTGQSSQSTKQRAHMRMVRSNGGIYLLVRSRAELSTEMNERGFTRPSSASASGP